MKSVGVSFLLEHHFHMMWQSKNKKYELLRDSLTTTIIIIKSAINELGISKCEIS